MKIGLRKKKLLWAGLIGASITLILAGIGGYFFYSFAQERELELKQKYKEELKILNETVKQNEIGYALNVEVEPGDLITEGMLNKVSLSAAAKSDDILEIIEVNTTNYFAKTNMKPKTVLVESMVYAEEALGNDIREAEYSFIELPTKLKTDDHVDVRIQFPNGDDYVLLSKKKVTDTLGLTMWMNMDEGEILTMSSAIVDAFVEEAKIYALPYVDGPMQAASQMTYPVKKNVLSLIAESPNVVNIMKLNLEKQNRERLEASLVDMDEEKRQKLRQRQAESDNKRKMNDEEIEINALNQHEFRETEQDLVGEPFTEGGSGQ